VNKNTANLLEEIKKIYDSKNRQGKEMVEAALSPPKKKSLRDTEQIFFN
jgi:hypothetical protein